MDTTQLLSELQAAAEAIGRARALVDVNVPTSNVVRAGADLQAALDKSGAITIESGATFEGTYFLRSGTQLSGGRILGKTGPALVIKPGTNDVSLTDVELGGTAREVLTIGENTDAQKTADAAPARIALTRVRIPTFRGKRGIAIHGQDVVLDGCDVRDLWDLAGADSQAVYIGNSPGRVTLTNCHLEAGSEVFLVGGEYPKIPDLVPTDIVVTDCWLGRPLSWRTDGVARKVKNIFELKSGRNVSCLRNTLAGCWADGQQGEAFTLTPALDGSKSTPILRSGIVERVTIAGCSISGVGGGLNILGRAYQAYTPTALTGLVVTDCTFRISRAIYGGRGQFITAGGGPGELVFENNRVMCDGTSAVYYYAGSVADASGATVSGGKIGSLTMRGNTLGILGSYGFMFDGYSNASNWANSVGALTVTGNTFGGPSTMAKYLPGNTWLPADQFSI